MGGGGQSESARRTIVVHTAWAWFWFANIPPIVVSFFLVDRGRWEAFMLIYLAVVSIWANAATHLSRSGAARAEIASAEPKESP